MPLMTKSVKGEILPFPLWNRALCADKWMGFFAEVSDSEAVARGRKKIYTWAEINSL